ncbi:hypothetical protein T484DRAFT_1901460 [Baffinella frigidus]|nr:hypothetical protein T484DRAFT_1901460 [Cryptophyta sp. CCMP2293]
MSGRRVVAVPKPVPFRNKTPAEIRARREKDVQKRKKETAGTDTSELTGRARASFTELMRQRGEWAELEKIDNADEKAFIMRNKKKTANMDEILALLDKPPAERTSKKKTANMDEILALLDKPPAERTSKDLSAISDQLRASNVYARLVDLSAISDQLRASNVYARLDLSAISDQLRVSNVYARLVVSPEIEVHVARIVGYRRFTSKGGVVVRENQEAENFYAVLEGSLLIQHQDMDVMPDPDEALILEVGWMQKKSYIILANVVEGLGLAAADQTGTSDPFVKVKCGTTEVCTRTVAHTINPVWDQILRIEADDDVVELIVFDHDAWGDDDYLGSCLAMVDDGGVELIVFDHDAWGDDDDLGWVEVLLSDLAKNMNNGPIQVSGTLTFNLQLTSVDYQEKLVKAIQEEKDVGGLPRNIMVAGDTLGEEQDVTGHGLY